VPSYTLVNARLTYAAPHCKWNASLSAENLLDKFYRAQLTQALQSDRTATTYGRTGVPGRGREVAFSFRRNFN
jgi:outer membrane receptor protein involved in Fe transport